MKQPANDELVSLFFSAGRIFKQKLGLLHPVFQLPPAQTETLRLIWENKQVSMKEVANFLAITPPSATVLINHLVTAGYVQRILQPNDRRTICLSLTAKGEATLHKAIKARCSRLKKMLGKLTPTERLNLLHLLKKMF